MIGLPTFQNFRESFGTVLEEKSGTTERSENAKRSLRETTRKIPFFSRALIEIDLKLFQKGEVLKNHFVTGVPKWILMSKLGGSVRVNFAVDCSVFCSEPDLKDPGGGIHIVKQL